MPRQSHNLAVHGGKLALWLFADDVAEADEVPAASASRAARRPSGAAAKEVGAL